MSNVNDIHSNPMKDLRGPVTQKSSTTPKKPNQAEASKKQEDMATISPAAPKAPKNELQKIQEWAQQAKGLEDVRNDKVAEAKARMASGHYNDPKVLQNLLDELEKEIIPE